VVARLSAAEVATALGKIIGEVKALRHRGLAALAGVLDLPGVLLKWPGGGEDAGVWLGVAVGGVALEP
jgi:hypothetical protein